jgi:hypothetical protein
MANKWNLEGVAVDTLNNMTLSNGLTVGDGGIIFPTSDPLVAGAWWDNAGTLTKSTGS